jgi:hypothetical protein
MEIATGAHQGQITAESWWCLGSLNLSSRAHPVHCVQNIAGPCLGRQDTRVEVFLCSCKMWKKKNSNF